MTRVKVARLRFIFNKQIGAETRYKVFKWRYFSFSELHNSA